MSVRVFFRPLPERMPGSVATLAEAVRLMARMQLNAELSPPEIDEIICFLHALEGEHPLQIDEAYVPLRTENLP